VSALQVNLCPIARGFGAILDRNQPPQGVHRRLDRLGIGLEERHGLAQVVVCRRNNRTLVRSFGFVFSADVVDDVLDLFRRRPPQTEIDHAFAQRSRRKLSNVVREQARVSQKQ